MNQTLVIGIISSDFDHLITTVVIAVPKCYVLKKNANTVQHLHDVSAVPFRILFPCELHLKYLCPAQCCTVHCLFFL